MKSRELIKKACRAVCMPITKNTVFVVGLYVLGVATAVLTLPHTASAKLYGNLWLELFLDLYLLSALLCLVGRKIRSILKLLLSIFFFVLAIVDVYCFEKYGMTLSPSLLMLVGETDSREAGEFLRSCLSWDTLNGGVGWILLIALGYFILEVRGTRCEVRDYLLSRTEKQGAKRFLASRTSHLTPRILLLLLLVIAAVKSYQNKVGIARLLMLSDVGAVEDELTRFHRAELYQPVYRLAFSIRANQLAVRQVRHLQEVVQGAGAAEVRTYDGTNVPTIVLIIGESYNKHHAQLYGYDLPTTPRQLQREQSGQLVKFTDVVTPWNLTSFVFKLMFSTHVIGEEGAWSDYPLFPALFRKAGYEVTFLTNQFLPKAKDAVYDFSGGFFLNDSQLSAAMFDYRNDKTHPWDNGLLSDWDQHSSPINTQHPIPNLVIFHLLGQHLNYYSRYPKTQTHFRAYDYNDRRPELREKQRQQIAWYDNATLYNDSIVDEICRRFEDSDAVVVYVPDHGEEVYEPGRHVICRNHTEDIDFPLAYHEYEIPFWIWCSRKYIDAHPQLFQEITDAKDRCFMTDALPHMLLYLAGIQTKYYHPEYNILSPQYNEHRPRLLKNRVDYDALRMNN